MKTSVNSRQMISGELVQKTLRSARGKADVKLCELIDQVLKSYSVLSASTLTKPKRMLSLCLLPRTVMFRPDKLCMRS